ncbi:MAG: ABC transporter substrate-binding protein [Deltaproteobacteria bacterium]|nr:ABC transporter substrate-binding protein [Deltaproteobacteria bacterium]
MKKNSPVRLGLMPPMTGLVEMYGQEISWAGQIACQEVNENGGVLGKPLELIVEDDGSLPDSAVKAAEKLTDHHRCSAIIGNLLSNSRIAVAYRVAEPRKIPYLNFSFYEGGILSRYFFHFAALPNQQIDRMIPYMGNKFGLRMYFAGNNYEWPRGSIDAAKRALLQAGGTVLGEEYLPFGAPMKAIELLIQHVRASGADVFVPYFAGQDQINLLTLFTQMGMKNRMAVVMGHYDEAMAGRLSPQVREGFYSSNTYFMTVNTPQNNQYLERLAKLPGVTGIWPQGNGILTNFGEGTYLCVKAFAQAANAAGSLDPEALVDALESMTLTGPQGTVVMDPVTHHARVNAYLTRCEKDGTFPIVESFGTHDPVIPERYRHMGTQAKPTQEHDMRLAARILEYMTDGVLLIRAEDGTVVFANPGAEAMFGYPRGGLNGLSMARLYAPTDLPPEETARSINERLYQSGVWKGDTQYRNQRNEPFWCSVSISAFTHAEHGEVWMAVQKNITQQKQAEEHLLESRKYLYSVITAAPLGLMTVDTQGRVNLCSGNALSEMGLSEGTCRGKTLKTMFPDFPKILDSLHQSQQGEAVTLDLQIGQRDYEIRFSPMFFSQKDKPEVTMVWMDVTDKKIADRMKREFVSTVSHELRTPLTSIRGAMGLIQTGQIAIVPPDLVPLLDIISRNAERLTLLINDLLDIEKMEYGGMEFDLKPLDMKGLVQHSANITQPYAQHHQVYLEVAVPEAPVFVQGDFNRLLQVMSNLISNAVKFSPPGSKVNLSLECHGDSARVRVMDRGRGISDDFRGRIFQKFAQQDSTDTREKGGTGLGLAITKVILEKHTGQIDFISQPGQGTEFFFDLPTLSHGPADA